MRGRSECLMLFYQIIFLDDVGHLLNLLELLLVQVV